MHQRSLLALLIVLILSGCGTSDEERVEEALKQFWTAVVDGDETAACGLLTDDAQEFYGLAAASGACRDGIERLIRAQHGPDEGMPRRLAAAEYEVTLDGERARASEARAGCYEMQKVEGKWLWTGMGCT